LEWSPFYQDRPVVRARVIAPRDHVAELDQKLITDAPSVTDSPSVFSDRRQLEAPLPRLAIGAVVEHEIVIVNREPRLAAGRERRMRDLAHGTRPAYDRLEPDPRRPPAPDQYPRFRQAAGTAHGIRAWPHDLDVRSGQVRRSGASPGRHAERHRDLAEHRLY